MIVSASSRGTSCSVLRRISGHQLASTIILVLSSGLFYSVCIPTLGVDEEIGITVSYSVLLLTVLALAGLSAWIDSSDPAVKLKRDPSHHPNQLDRNLFPKVCVVCQTRVQIQSKHCSKCNRCIAEFDHHCVWLNNCVGKDNYRFFFSLVISLELFCMLQLTTEGRFFYLLLSPASSQALLSVLPKQQYGTTGLGWGLVGLMACAAMVICVVAVGNGYLVAFHLYLKWRGVTTYEYILLSRRNHPRVYPQPQKPRPQSFSEPPLAPSLATKPLSEHLPLHTASFINLELSAIAVELYQHNNSIVEA